MSWSGLIAWSGPCRLVEKPVSSDIPYHPQAFTAFRGNAHIRADKRSKAARAAVRLCRVTETAAMATWRECAATQSRHARRTAQRALAALRHRVVAVRQSARGGRPLLTLQSAEQQARYCSQSWR